jgi:hypothetical protein
MRTWGQAYYTCDTQKRLLFLWICMYLCFVVYLEEGGFSVQTVCLTHSDFLVGEIWLRSVIGMYIINYKAEAKGSDCSCALLLCL